MLTAYREFATIDASAFAAALQALSARIETPALIHCTAGKDRTGWLVALVQSFLGARHDAVLADYLATNVYWDRRAPLPADLDPEMTNALLDADASYLDAAFDMLARTQGSPARFVRRALGDEAAARLEAALTEQKCDP
jgi:protein-tyrosine phosphatase